MAGNPSRSRVRYAESGDIHTEQLVRGRRQLLSTKRVVLDAIITLFVRLAGLFEGAVNRRGLG